jgi:UDP-N-acetylmuramoyl-tripeptide--D-alanyl-D-alanine ligase
MKKILQTILTVLAKAMIRRYKPTIVAITGSVGKTSTKEAVFAVLNQKFHVKAASGNLNNELGVPLTILGDFADEYYSRGPSVFFWLKVILMSLVGLMHYGRYPEILVLEYGADRPGDIRKLVTNFKPHVSILTSIGHIPSHVEFFESPEAVTKEKSLLVTKLNSDDFAVLNAEDERIIKLKDSTKAKVISYGLSKDADVVLSDVGIGLNDDGKPEGVNFKLTNGGVQTPVSIFGSLGHSHALAAAAGAAVGLVFKMNLADIARGLNSYKGANGRLKLLKGAKNSTIIDDTYNSSPNAARLALETLKHIPAERKVAILGDMLELGQYTEQTHKEVGELAGRVAQFLITVGLRAKFIAETASVELGQENVLSFSSVEEAKDKILDLIKTGDVVLVKGSQGMRLEKIVEEIMAEPDRKGELLVRQSQKWLVH